MLRLMVIAALGFFVQGAHSDLAFGQTREALENKSIYGKILTEKGVPVPGFPVILEGEGSSFVALTDERGDYTAKGLQPGQYKAIGANNLGNEPGFEINSGGILSGDVNGDAIETIVIPHNW